MPLDPITVGAIMRGSLAGAGVIGSGSSLLAAGLATALCTYGKAGMTVTTIDVGTLGVGKGTGFGVIVPVPVLLASLMVSLPAGGIAGVSSVQLAAGISTGYSASLASAIINTIHPSVGLGSGKLQILPNAAAAIGIFISCFLAAGMKGPSAIPLATAVAKGLNAVLPTAMGIVVIAGPPNIVPSSGIGSGQLI